MAGTTTTPPAPAIATGELAELFRRAINAAGVETLTLDSSDGRKVAIAAVPTSRNLVSLKRFIDEFATQPDRRIGTAQLRDLGTFIRHFLRFRSEDSAIFANRSEREPRLTAVFDYHPAKPDPTAAAFMQHRASYPFPLSLAWQTWRDIDGKEMGQAAFAAFIDLNIADILPAPTDGRNEASAMALDLLSLIGGRIGGPTEIMEISRRLRVMETAEVINAKNISNGEIEVAFKTQHMNEQGQPLRIPNCFLVGFPVFDGDAAYRMPVRLNYRRKDGAILWTIQRYRPDVVFFDAFDRALARVREEAGFDPYIGAPES